MIAKHADGKWYPLDDRNIARERRLWREKMAERGPEPPPIDEEPLRC